MFCLTLETFNELNKNNQNETLSHIVEEGFLRSFTLEDLTLVSEKILSPDLLEQHFGVIGLNKLLTHQENNDPTEIDFDTNLLPRLVEFLNIEQFPFLQLESACALSHLVRENPKNIKEIIDSGGVLNLLKLLDLPNEKAKIMV